jgi:hypothetical protein
MIMTSFPQTHGERVEAQSRPSEIEYKSYSSLWFPAFPRRFSWDLFYE